MTGKRFAAAGLLTIDVSEEVRKLAEARLAGQWQLPAELVRRAVAAGARSIECRLSSHGIDLVDDGRSLPASLVEGFAAVLDETTPPDVRQQALSALEAASDGKDLITLAAHGSLLLESGALRLESKRGVVVCKRLASARGGTRIAVRDLPFDRAEAARWLAAACRHAPARITLDGRPLSRGFADAIAEVVIDAPPGSLALVREPSLARIVLLQHGVVTTHLTLPNAPPFEAALEMPEDASPASLRADVVEHVPGMVEKAVSLALAQVVTMPSLDAAAGRALRLVLLIAVRGQLQLFAVMAAPMLRELSQGRWLSLREVVEAAGTSRSLCALYPHQDPAHFVLPDPTLCLDDEERALLARSFGLCFRMPAAHASAGTWWRGWYEAAGRLGGGLRRLGRPGRPLPEAALTSEERTLRRGLSGILPDASVEITEGGGMVRRAAGRSNKWLLPRRNPLVRAAATRAIQDPAWLYPAALALLEGSALPSKESREAWRNRSR